MRSRALLSNLSSLIFALFLGVVIWVIAVNSENPLMVRENFPEEGIPIELEHVPQDLAPLTGGDQKTRLRIRAPRDHWAEIDADQFRAWVDLKGFNPGLYEVPVRVEQAQPADPQIRILSYTPEAIPIRLDRIEEQKMQVEVEVVDRATMPTSYEILTPTVDPPTVTIRGPSTRLERVDRVVARVQASGSRATIEIEAEVQLLDRIGDTVPTGPGATDLRILPAPVVDVTLPIQPRQGYRELIVQPIIVGEPARGYWIGNIDVSPRTISVVGLPASVAALSSTVETEPIDVTGLEESTLTRQVRVNLPPDVSPLKGDRLVTVSVEIEAIRSSQRISVTPDVSGLQAGLEVKQIAPSSIQVLVEGPVSELEQLEPEDIGVVLDLTSLREGTHLVEPRVTPPGALEASSTIPRQVEVTIGIAEDTRQISRPVTIRGVPAGLRAVTTPDTVTVTVRGPALDLERLPSERISVAVDLEERDAGTYSLTPTITVITPFTVTAVTPPRVEVTVEPASSVVEIEQRLSWRGLGPGLILNLTPLTVTLSIRGRGSTASVREAIRESTSFRTVVDVSDLDAGRYTLVPQVMLPDGFQLLSVRPNEIVARLSAR